jgi:REP element-mobilizing transposase RayT
VNDRYQNKYRIDSTRLPGWDYASPGCYFVTLVTRARAAWFGKIAEEIMRLSEMGEIVRYEWLRIPAIRSNVTLDQWVIMPDHLHGIIVIHPETPPAPRPVETPPSESVPGCVPCGGVSTQSPWKPGTLGVIINHFKSRCTKSIRAAGGMDFAWQSRFYERILRDEQALQNVRAYIRLNPARWANDLKAPGTK